ncbi:MAG: MBL fold metallo-hydrolase [Candidatus Diapherotrites archaeon]|nr:MBL fold metallo-hydrolase [Candidatus Diapherotrites archaeon]
MKIQFLGAAREVGRSAVLVDTGESKVLLDYGLKISSEDVVAPLRPLPVHGYLDAVILSHAHLDHCGAIPYLFKAAEPDVFTHPATVPIMEMLIKDSVNIARSRKQDSYQLSSLKRVLRKVKPSDYGHEYEVTSDISFEFQDAGHILGASMTKMHVGDYKVVYTGDFKDEDTRLHKGAKPPGKADVIIVEATYGNKEHPDRKELENEFIEDVKAVVDSGGSVLLPCFAVGRAQEIVQLLYANKLHVPVYMDGMARAISEIYLEHPELIRDYNEFYNAMRWVNWITNPRQRQEVFNEPSIIVTTAGMLSGGPAMEYLPELKTLKNSALFFTGFQVPGTPGRQMLEEKKMNLGGILTNFSNVNIKYFDFSAHCDSKGIHKFIKAADPKLVLVNHGEEEQCNSVVEWVKDEIGCYAFAPELRDKFELKDFVG